MLETLAFQSLYGGQFTLLTLLINLILLDKYGQLNRFPCSDSTFIQSS